jgi:hypothetical protein
MVELVTINKELLGDSPDHHFLFSNKSKIMSLG